MKDVIFLEELIAEFCEEQNESFFSFGILPTEISFYNDDKYKGKLFQQFLKKNKIKTKLKIEGGVQIFEF